MKKITFLLLWALLTVSGFQNLSAQTANLLPQPLSYTAGSGEFEFSNVTNLSYPAYDGDSIQLVAERFAADFNIATGLNITTAQANTSAAIQLIINSALEPEAYHLQITTNNITIEAAKPAGFYYALHSLKQLMPANVMAVVPDVSVTEWRVPAANITDNPRFPWRGFMLDVGRHFFDVDQVKRVIDMMAVHKMNRFHWHLTEDQGWRIEIKKYPKLTEVGSVRRSQVWNDYEGGTYYDNIPYGPFFYTQDDIREVVAYAKERFIEVIPEVDMPGHFVAALVAYPEYSCTPNANREVWVNYGISGDVLNVGNPAAINFVKDILDELIPLFPYNYIHIGGDECPTNAWQNNAQCQALLASLGSTNYRDLQTYFFKEIENHLRNKENPAERRKVIAWNETLGGNLDGSDVTIMSWIDWYNAAKTAANKGLDVIMTPQVPYYINRKQAGGSDEPKTQGSGTETLEAVYNFEPVPGDATPTQASFIKGVQGNFWTEWVSENSVVEYLMLPRLAAIAERGWSPKTTRDFSNFVGRVRQLAEVYDLKGWDYGKHYMSDNQLPMPEVSTESDKQWFRLISACTDDNRKEKCIELLPAGSPLIGTGNAQANRLWSNTQAAEGAANFENQWWCLIENPSNPGHYALVNKANANGSLKSTATAGNNTGRWDYDNSTRHYNFIIGEQTMSSNDIYYYTIRSTSYTDMYMNVAAGGQNFSINLWNNPFDGQSGLFSFTPMLAAEKNELKSIVQEMRRLENAPTYQIGDIKNPGSFSASAMAELSEAIVTDEAINSLGSSAEIATLKSSLNNKLNTLKASLAYPEVGQEYRIFSTKYDNVQLVSSTDNKAYGLSSFATGADTWKVENVTQISGTYSVSFRLHNTQANKYLALSMPIELSNTASIYKAVYDFEYGDFEIFGVNTPVRTAIFPMPENAWNNPSAIMRDGLRPQGTGWRWEAVENTTNVSKNSMSAIRAYSYDGKIHIEGAENNSLVQLRDALGRKMLYSPIAKLPVGVYLVTVDTETHKVVVR